MAEFAKINKENIPAGKEGEIELLLSEIERMGMASSIGLLSFGGATAYGLDTDKSDLDLRGFFLPSKRDLLLMSDVGTVEVKDGTDACMHSAKKVLSLLAACNPNVIEILGLRPEHVVIGSKWYDLILENKDIFLTKKCGDTFGGYASQQLRRIENSMSRDKGDTDTEGARRSMESAIAAFTSRYGSYAEGDIAVELLDEEEGAKKLYVSLDLERVPVNELRGMCGELDAIAKNADNLAARNRKKKTEKLSKHMSHLIRLLRMGTEILEFGEVNTYREDDAQILLALKKGLWMEEDSYGVRHIDDKFWELLHEGEEEFERARRITELPDDIDLARVEKLEMEMHESVLFE